MSKLGDFFKHFKDKYDEEQKRLMRMDKFLDRAEENNDKLHAVATAVDNIGGQVEELKSKVDDLQGHITHMDGRLAIIGEGTNGNGQGKVYFEQIMALPENPPESNN